MVNVEADCMLGPVLAQRAVEAHEGWYASLDIVRG